MPAMREPVDVPTIKSKASCKRQPEPSSKAANSLHNANPFIPPTESEAETRKGVQEKQLRWAAPERGGGCQQQGPGPSGERRTAVDGQYPEAPPRDGEAARRPAQLLVLPEQGEEAGRSDLGLELVLARVRVEPRGFGGRRGGELPVNPTGLAHAE